MKIVSCVDAFSVPRWVAFPTTRAEMTAELEALDLIVLPDEKGIDYEDTELPDWSEVIPFSKLRDAIEAARAGDSSAS